MEAYVEMWSVVGRREFVKKEGGEVSEMISK